MTSRNETPTDELQGNSWGISGNYRDYCDSNILGVLETVTKTVICNLGYTIALLISGKERLLSVPAMLFV